MGNKLLNMQKELVPELFADMRLARIGLSRGLIVPCWVNKRELRGSLTLEFYCQVKTLFGM